MIKYCYPNILGNFMNQQLVTIPTMVEAKNLGQLNHLKDIYNKAKTDGELSFCTDFWVLRSKDNDFLAYFHDASKKPNLKETVEWMEKTDNLSFPGNVSISKGIMNRYDEKFQQELKPVISEVMDEYLERSRALSEIMDLIDGLVSKLPAESNSSVKLK